MEQLATKGKKCKSVVCTVCCLNSNGSFGSDDFVDCEKCDVSIHKICFKLSGELLKIFQDFERRNEKFPFTILCPECRQFKDKDINEVQVVDSCEESDNSKNPFEINCIVNVIVDHLNVQDLVNLRLVNKLWNENASRILSKESRQVQLRAYDVKKEIPNSAYLEECLQIVQNSEQVKLMHKWKFYFDTEGQYQNSNDLNVFNQIVTITKPTSVTICLYDGNLTLEENALFPTLLTNISENVVDFSLFFQEITGFDSTQFSMPQFSKLKSITINGILPENYEFMKMVIENSPNLMNLAISTEIYGHIGDDLTLDNYINEKSTRCILTENSARNIKMLNLSSTEFDFETFEMKLVTLSLHPNFPRYLQFGKLKTFLTTQNDTLENLKITFQSFEFVRLDEIEDLETVRMDLPRLENVKHFSLTFKFDYSYSDDVFIAHEEIWPVKPIHLAGKLPNLKKISITYCTNWACSFETEQNCHPGVTELVLKEWTGGDLTKLVGLFPQVEVLKLKKFCFNPGDNKKIYTKLDNLNGWSESLKRIEVSCKYYHLENFDFEKLVCLKSLESIKISQSKYLDPDGTSSHFIYPDFKPLFKIATLTQVVIKDFKISKGIVEDLREKYPSLDYSYYHKC